MPLYEFKCPDCEDEITKLVRKLDAPPPKCAKCAEGGKPEVEMKRKISESSFQLKGFGWYADGYS